MTSIHPTPTILIPHLPSKTFVGIDLVTFTSTANFHGIRDLPLGWHFLYSGTTETLSLRSGGWFYVHDDEDSGAVATTGRTGRAPEIFIWKWDAETETLVPLKGDSDAERQEALRLKANLGMIWQAGKLFRYRSRVTAQGVLKNQVVDEEDEEIEEEGRRDWTGLTDRLSVDVLSRIVGDPEVDADGRPRWMVTSASTAKRDTDDIPGLASAEPDGLGVDGRGRQEVEFSFLPIELRKTWREGAVGRERTEAAQDRSWALGDLIKQYTPTDSTDDSEGESQILGELQFTFLMALTLLNFSCLQQWKRLLELILTCRAAIAEREPFMCDVLRLLLLQLQRCDDLEGGFFAIDADEGGEFLRRWLVRFVRSFEEVSLVGAGSIAKGELDKLEAWVRSEYEWDLHPEGVLRRGMLQLEDGEEVEMEMADDEDEETGEYAPTVVELGGGF
ncbi:hypothetical protein SI65_07232 [Aspergillus cristatus]|uniref:Uncharacterized protein n=1 Tax=Aspergillus cristatus TaxID=573508 RepID=A0A1E3B9D6_ASPCR|nr:hypothetical protein SI65_07232 [Aspergillus cristatus]